MTIIGCFIRNNTLIFLFKFSKREIILFLISIFIIISINLLFLRSYPFHLIGDQLRDSGLDAMKIAQGNITNIFDFGNYNGYGRIISYFSFIFYSIFGNTDLTLKIQPIIISILDCIFIYLIARNFIARRFAFLAAILLATNLFHLFFSRTEVVIMFSALLTSIIIFFTLNYLKERNWKNLILLTIILGFSVSFHASIWSVIFFTIIFIFFYLSYEFILKKIGYKKFILSILILFSFFIVFIGPKIDYLDATKFVSTHSLSINTKNSIDNNLKTKDLVSNISKAELVYVIQKSYDFHLNYPTTILNIFLAPFFLIGLFLPALKKNKYFLFITFLVITVPIVNGGLANPINQDNRLLPSVVLATLIAIYAIYEILKIKFSSNILKFSIRFLLIILVIVSIFINLYLFFIQEVGGRSMFRMDNNDYQDYLLKYAINTIVDNNLNKSLCLEVSQYNFNYLKLLHIKEQFNYYLPDYKIQTQVNNSILDNEIYITKNCNIQKILLKEFEYCKIYEKYICPSDKKILEVYVE